MESSLYKMQYALRTCEEHNEKELTMFCNSCKQKVCSMCLRQNHMTHEWDLMCDLAKKMRKQLPGICRKIKDNDISEIKRHMKLFQSLITTTESNSQKAEEDLNKVRISLIKDINEFFDCKIVDNEKHIASTKGFKEKLESLEKKLQYLEMMTNALDSESETFTDHDLIEMEQEMMTALDNAQSYNAEKFSHYTGFLPKKINVETVVGVMGEIHNITVEETTTFKKFSSTILTITLESERTAWVREGNSKTAKLITESGEKVKCLSTECTDLTVLPNGNFAWTHYKDTEVTIMNDTEEVIEKINTKPLHPTWISHTENTEILVTMIDDGDHYNLSPSSRRIVRRMALKGKVLHTYEFEEDGKTRLFTLPWKTVENKNTDLCVTNRTSHTSSHLVVLCREGNVKFTYKGHSSSPNNFCSIDVACDSKCRIIISEYLSKSLHLLSPRGQFIGVIRCFYNVQASVRGEKLFVGFGDGSVSVYKYEPI